MSVKPLSTADIFFSSNNDGHWLSSEDSFSLPSRLHDVQKSICKHAAHGEAHLSCLLNEGRKVLLKSVCAGLILEDNPTPAFHLSPSDSQDCNAASCIATSE